MTRFLAVQPRHPNAPQTGEGQVYLPGALLSAVSRILVAAKRKSERDPSYSLDVEIADENFAALTESELAAADVVGTNTIGPSCLPQTIDLEKRVLAVNPDATLLHGGQVISSLDGKTLPRGERFSMLFSERSSNGNDVATLATTLGLEVADLSSSYETSLIPALELLPEGQLRPYLQNRFSLYVSQGCKLACSFCSATKGMPEMYRDVRAIKNDLEWLCGKAETFDIGHLNMYMTNLDVFQTPGKLKEFADVVRDVQTGTGVGFVFTALSTVDSYRRTMNANPDLLDTMHDVGLTHIAFGVEGSSPALLKKLKKGHNAPKGGIGTNEVIDDAVRRGYIVEVLLTPGHEQESIEDIQNTLAYAQELKKKYVDQVIIRPYAAKNFLVGNEGWFAEGNKSSVDFLLENPAYFQHLDINAEQSVLTEPDPVKRAAVNDVFRQLCVMSGGAAEALVPIDPLNRDSGRENQGKYDH